jgi:hypothetical protein
MTLTNKQFSTSESFVKACEAVDVKATSRQASKWRMGKGLAWKRSRERAIAAFVGNSR